MKNTINIFGIIIASICIFSSCEDNENHTIALDGEWQFQMDSDDVGVQEQWYNTSFSDVIQLPGSMRENLKGNDPDLETPWTASIYDSSWYFNPALEKFRQPGNMKFPFWLTPVKYYLGAAWYKKTVSIPENWKNKQLILHLERPHWETTVWVDSSQVGTQNSLSTPHTYVLPKLASGKEHTITIRVDNRSLKVDVGHDSHSISDHTQGNWNGIVGDLSIEAVNSIYFEDIQLYPNIKEKNVKAQVVLASTSNKIESDLRLRLSATSFNSEKNHKVPEFTVEILTAISDTIDMVYPMGDNMLLWDEFDPALYNMKAELLLGNEVIGTKEIRFGMRDFSIKDTRFYINGRQTFLRGTLENCQFPLTGYPPTNEEDWIKVFEKCRESGLNHMRFHSWCPPEAAFAAADRMGFFLQPEAASWANHGTSLGRGRPVDQYIYDETERIIKAYGNHPSFVMWAYGNEPRGPYVDFLDEYLIYWKNKDKRRVYTGAAIGMSWSVIPESEFMVRSGPRGLPFKGMTPPNSTFNYFHKIKDEPRPYVTHEMGQYCVFPNFNEIPKYTGVHKAKNFEMFQEILQDNKMGDQAQDFLMASGKLQVLCYKAEIEASLRTNGLAGYQLLGLPDFPGQGSAIVGMLDVFWDEKGYITYDEIKQFQSETVPLAEFEKFEFTSKDTLQVDVKVAHFGQHSLNKVAPVWTITTDDSTIIKKGTLPVQDIEIGNGQILGQITWPLHAVKTASKFKMEIAIQNHINHWEFWVYPEITVKKNHSNVYLCKVIDDAAIAVLKDGGNVLLMAAGKVENGKEVKQNFTPVFWNTSWFKMRPPHTTGVFIQNEHPVFKDFPTEYHSNYQWWSILNRQQVMNLENFPPDFRPIVQPIDTWFLNRRLGMIFEAKVENGKILVCSSDLETSEQTSPAAKQLLYSIHKYVSGDQFNPSHTINLKVVKELFEVKDRKEINLYTKGNPDELKPSKALKNKKK